MICRYKIKFISDIEQKIRKLLVNIAVAPFVGVWIEISVTALIMYLYSVAPFVGVWIEISSSTITLMLFIRSLPSWECGLKYYKILLPCIQCFVAPFVGVWIEIHVSAAFLRFSLASLPSWECGLKYEWIQITVSWTVGRSLRGSVD